MLEAFHRSSNLLLVKSWEIRISLQQHYTVSTEISGRALAVPDVTSLQVQGCHQRNTTSNTINTTLPLRSDARPTFPAIMATGDIWRVTDKTMTLKLIHSNPKLKVEELFPVFIKKPCIIIYYRQVPNDIFYLGLSDLCINSYVESINWWFLIGILDSHYSRQLCQVWSWPSEAWVWDVETTYQGSQLM